jgi:hypothetical protein
MFVALGGTLPKPEILKQQFLVGPPCLPELRPHVLSGRPRSNRELAQQVGKGTRASTHPGRFNPLDSQPSQFRCRSKW